MLYNIEQKILNFFIFKGDFMHSTKKWPFLATFGKIALSQPKRIQIKKKQVPLESAKAKLQNKTKKLYF